jgi:hypothetical protein
MSDKASSNWLRRILYRFVTHPLSTREFVSHIPQNVGDKICLDIMSISESDILEWFSSAYAQRGERYQQQGRVSNLRRVDGELRAQCEGSRPQPYAVRATVEDGRLVTSRCSCPIGGGSDRLVDLITTYARHHPDFESWVETQLAAEGGEAASVDRADMRRRVMQIVMREAQSQSYRNPANFEDLEGLSRTARAYIDAGLAENAADILAPIAHCLIEDYYQFDDSHGRVVDRIDHAASDLIDAFEVADDWERQTLVDWVQQALEEQGPRNEQDEYTSNWHRQRLGRMLLELEGDSLSEEETIEVVEQAAMDKWWIRQLLERGEVERARGWTAQLPFSDQLKLVDDFVDNGSEDVAEEIFLRVEAKSGKRLANRARVELVEFYAASERWEEGLTHALEEFNDHPRRDILHQIESFARELGRWEELETELLNRLAEEAPRELVWYYIEDDDPDAAVAIWRSADISPRRLGAKKFAKAIADSHPDIAVELFNETAESLIARRGRSNYREACELIGRIRDTYESFERMREWKRYRDQLLADYNNLPAFKDEMRKAELS